MSRTILEDAFASSRHHVSPFLMLGDPTPELSVELAIHAARGGASMLELGIPYSDPCADGPAIQRACLRAANAGISTGEALEILAAIHRAEPSVPLNLLVYGNLVHARGYARFCRDAVAAGAASLLVPDIPLDEAGPLAAACTAADLGHVEMIAPLTTPERLAAIDAATDAFLYLAAHQGVTGAEISADETRSKLVGRIVPAVRNPVCLGFGLSSPANLAAGFGAGARLCVVGSHLVRTIEHAWDDGNGEPTAVISALTTCLEPLVQVGQEYNNRSEEE